MRQRAEPAFFGTPCDVVDRTCRLCIDLAGPASRPLVECGTSRARVSGMRCREIMHRSVFTVRETDNVGLVARLMREENVGFVPVLDSDDVLVGVVTDRDVVIRGCAGTQDPREVTASTIMSREPITCRPNDDVAEVERRLRKHRVGRLVVVDADGSLCGVLSLSDIAQYDSPASVGRTFQAIAERKYAF